MTARDVIAPKISEDDIRAVWPCAIHYLAEILNGEYSVEEARTDVVSLIGSKFDPRALPDGGVE